MSQCTTTVYGTEYVSFDIETPSIKSRAYSAKTLARAVVFLLLLVIPVTVVVYRFHDNISKITGFSASFKTKTNKLSDTVTITNCANDADLSCDAQYGCTTYEDDISRVVSNIASRWEDYTQFITDTTDVTIDGDVCIQKKFIKNHLVCNDNCDELGYEVNVQPMAGNLCKNTFLRELQSVLKPYRRSCISALIAHQFATLCGRNFDTANTIEKATFLWWKDRYKVGDSWTHEDCPYYI